MNNRFQRWDYVNMIQSIPMSVREYNQLKNAFQGGFTHANPWYANRVCNNVTSFDFTSSYPAVMVAEKFPMSRGEYIDITSTEQFYKNIELYCCLFDIEFTEIESTVTFENYISSSRCWTLEKPQVANGRVVRASLLRTTITEQDFLIIRKMYRWKTCRVGNFCRYQKFYLPTDFVKSVLKLYSDKTTLKNVSGKEIEYLAAKEQLNACYGMTVTDPVRPVIKYVNDWPKEPPKPDVINGVKDYNDDSSRFLCYQWGVWITAYARRNLFSGILECGNDYVYADTDSIKIMNPDDHLQYIEKYNKMITEQLNRACKHHGIDPELTRPKTIKGTPKPLGVWDFDGEYARFKTLGAKRYMFEYSLDERNKEHRGELSITVSGLNKNVCVPFLCDGWYYGRDGIEHNSPFDKFTDQLYVPPEYTGKRTHTYIDEERHGVVYDYKGVPYAFTAPSAVHLENSDYSLSIAREFADYIYDIQQSEE